MNDIHFPRRLLEVERGRRRLAFEEMFLLQVALALRRHHRKSEVVGWAMAGGDEVLSKFVEALPFDLSGDQHIVLGEIIKDIKAPSPMNRLLQGDVGSGKTVVALAAAVYAVGSGAQVAVMAPTEILAEQHHRRARPFLEAVGVSSTCLTGGRSEKERRGSLRGITDGAIDIVFGTHALIQSDVTFCSLGLAIIDEQHRFGVEQRVTLKEKGHEPDTLVMTATPIPRTLALTLYGDLDRSVIRRFPMDISRSQHVTTHVVPASAWPTAYRAVREAIDRGEQAYVVVANIEESEARDAVSVDQAVERVESVLGRGRTAIMHGRLGYEDKSDAMDAFERGDIPVLVSTTVIEVGVDVANATVMVIEDADLFGLSQLHQLRGRVGRGGKEASVFAVSRGRTDEGIARLRAFGETADGFELAEKDFEIRGGGELFGQRQAGLTDLRIARLLEDDDLVEMARKDVETMFVADEDFHTAAARLMLEEAGAWFSRIEWLSHG